MTAIMRRTSIWTGHNPDGQPVTLRIPLALTGPAGPSAPDIAGPGQAAGPRPGWADPGPDRSGRWLRNAAAGLCVLAAAAAAVSFAAFGTGWPKLPATSRPSPRWRPPSPTPPPWCSPAWASRWPCTAAARSVPAR